MSTCSNIPAWDKAGHDSYCGGRSGCDWPGRADEDDEA